MLRLAGLPVGGLQVVEIAEGELLFLSDHGLYALRGPALDLWRGAKLISFEETVRLAGRIGLSWVKLDVADLGAIGVGAGPEVVIFVAPLCPRCASFRAAPEALAETYRYPLRHRDPPAFSSGTGLAGTRYGPPSRDRRSGVPG
jgi:thiol:disulfide interchange protein DsbC